jgi:hypothetical protein
MSGRLRRQGIRVRQSRNAGLIALSADPPVCERTYRLRAALKHAGQEWLKKSLPREAA